nr:retrovirus-related Pol polyprotein from transposon TNT 1-94 [Tanacetum cinerariifolium]
MDKLSGYKLHTIILTNLLHYLSKLRLLENFLRNLKVHEMIIKKDFEIVKAKGERKSLTLKAKKESSDEECSTSRSKMKNTPWRLETSRSFLEKRFGDPNHLIGECPKPPKDKNQRAFIGGSWSDSGEEYDEKIKDEMCLVAHASSEICLGVDLEPDEWIKDSIYSMYMMGNRKLFSSYKAYNGASKELVRNLPKLKFDQHFCLAFKIGKQVHASHKAKNIVSMTRCLELLHMGLFGPSVVRSYRGNRYTLVIVDDYSMYTSTRFLKDKTEAFDQFEIFIKKIQNQLGCTIVSIRSDHGREFDNEVQFEEFCNAKGITHSFSSPHTPQSNGVIERKKRTLQEMSRTMLNKQSLPQKFWCNIVDTSTYILNQILIRAILGETLMSHHGDENPICTLGDYSKPSHEVYRNTIELLKGNNMVPLRSDTIRLCSFHGVRSEDPNKHLRDFLKLVDLLDLDGENKERTRRTVKLYNDILLFQQHQGESLSEAWTRFKDLLQKKSAKIPSLKGLSSFEVIACGTLNLHMTCSHENFSACLSFSAVTGLTSTYLVECSMSMARNFRFPGATDRGPKMSIPQ